MIQDPIVESVRQMKEFVEAAKRDDLLEAARQMKEFQEALRKLGSSILDRDLSEDKSEDAIKLLEDILQIDAKKKLDKQRISDLEKRVKQLEDSLK